MAADDNYGGTCRAFPGENRLLSEWIAVWPSSSLTIQELNTGLF